MRLPPLSKLFHYPRERWYVEMAVAVGLEMGYKLTDAWSVGLEQKVRSYMYRRAEDEPWDETFLLPRRKERAGGELKRKDGNP
jgi:hypothetical protein